jgi:hypothetical protein
MAIATVSGTVLGGTVYFFTISLGELSSAFSIVFAVGSAYLIMSEPTRSFDKANLMQAREAPVLAAAVAVHLQTTGSKSKAILMLNSEEEELSLMFDDLKRRTLLGIDPAISIRDLSPRIASTSVFRILYSIIDHASKRLEDAGEEMEGIFRASAMSEETKVPIFIAVSFFTPIMLVLLAAIMPGISLFTISSLALLQFVILDLTFSFSSTERKKISI